MIYVEIFGVKISHFKAVFKMHWVLLNVTIHSDCTNCQCRSTIVDTLQCITIVNIVVTEKKLLVKYKIKMMKKECVTNDKCMIVTHTLAYWPLLLSGKCLIFWQQDLFHQ